MRCLAMLLLAAVGAVAGEESFCGNRCSGEGLVTACACDRACAVYGDCCADAERADDDALSRETRCAGAARVVSACSPDWRGPAHIARACAEGASAADPVGAAPVTSPSSGVTYANYRCAVCNGDAADAAVWRIQLSCPRHASLSAEAAFDHIFFNRSAGEWGYALRDDASGRRTFRGCALAHEPPERLRGMVRPCGGDPPEVVGDCPLEWRMDTVREMCARFSDPVVVTNGTRRYRNYYCALCRGEDQSTLRCGGGGVRSRLDPPPPEGAGGLSFSLLLDVDFSGGNEVGKVEVVCRKGEIFDPFFRRCRNIVCGIPGFVMRDGLCVPDPTRPTPLL